MKLIERMRTLKDNGHINKRNDEYEYDYSSIYEDNDKSPVDNGEEMV